MKLKKLAASLLAAAMLFCGTTTTAFAKKPGCGGDSKPQDTVTVDVTKEWKGAPEGTTLPDSVTITVANQEVTLTKNTDWKGTVELPEKTDWDDLPDSITETISGNGSENWKLTKEVNVSTETTTKIDVDDVEPYERKEQTIFIWKDDDDFVLGHQGNDFFLWTKEELNDDLKAQLLAILAEKYATGNDGKVEKAVYQYGNGAIFKVNGKTVTFKISEFNKDWVTMTFSHKSAWSKFWVGEYDIEDEKTKYSIALTNTYKAPVEIKKDVTFTKKFVGDNIPEDAQNNEFTFTLTSQDSNNGSTYNKTVYYSDNANGVKVTFEDVPAGTYTLTESDVDGWKTDILNGVEVVVSANGVTFGGKSYSEEDPFTVANTYKAPVEIKQEYFAIEKVTKVWNDSEDLYKNRPSEITVQLYADNAVVAGKTLNLNDGNNWTGNFKNLPKYQEENGAVKVDSNNQPIEIEYTVKETNVPVGYEAKVTGSVENGFTITNTYKAPVEIKQNVTFTKEFEVTDGYTIPAGANFTFTFTLTPLIAELREAGEGNTIAPVTIEYSDKAVEVTFENVPAGTYTLTESYDGNWGTSIPNGVEVVVSANGVTFGGKSYSEEDPFTVTNTYNGDGYGEETFSIIVTKEWDDANNKDGIRPSSVTVELLALEDGELKVVDSADLNAGKDWTHIFTVRKYKESALLAFDDEFVEPDEIKYTIREESVPNGYTVSYKGLDKDDYVVFDDDEGSVIIKNSHTPTKEPTPIDRDDDDKEEKDDPDLTVRKVDKETDKLIKDQATFRIYKLSGSRKLYYTGSSWSSNVEKAKEYSTKNGKFTAYDLGAGTYYVEEVKAPSGYNLADDLKVKLTSKDKTVEFANSKAKQNPNTGALVLPLDLADAAVAAMTLGAAAWVISKSKK